MGRIENTRFNISGLYCRIPNRIQVDGAILNDLLAFHRLTLWVAEILRSDMLNNALTVWLIQTFNCSKQWFQERKALILVEILYIRIKAVLFFQIKIFPKSFYNSYFDYENVNFFLIKHCQFVSRLISSSHNRVTYINNSSTHTSEKMNWEVFIVS